jgi:RNA polymerase-binding transcription factor DksA
MPICKQINPSLFVYQPNQWSYKMENIASFDVESINQAVTEFAPAQVVVSGLTVSEKKLSVIGQASAPALAYLSNQKGKLGKYAREGLASFGEAMIAKHARGGNYKPLADAIAAITGASLTIRNRAEFDTLSGRFEDQLRDLKNGGYVECKKTGADKPSAKRNTLMQVLALVQEVQAIAAAI